jgi:hypothetical protein
VTGGKVNEVIPVRKQRRAPMRGELPAVEVGDRNWFGAVAGAGAAALWGGMAAAACAAVGLQK